MTEIFINSREDLDCAAEKIGLPVGERTGRSKVKKEWYVALRFLKGTIPFLFELPIMVRNGVPPNEPDFVMARDSSTIGLLEITEATVKADQKEMTAFEQPIHKAAMIGELGGRFGPDKSNPNCGEGIVNAIRRRGGASNPGQYWATDVVNAIRRKGGKAIFANSSAPRHLLIYPNSNASILLFDESDEREAINHLHAEIAEDRTTLSLTANGCLVHVIGKYLILFDVFGEWRVLTLESNH